MMVLPIGKHGIFTYLSVNCLDLEIDHMYKILSPMESIERSEHYKQMLQRTES